MPSKFYYMRVMYRLKAPWKHFPEGAIVGAQTTARHWYIRIVDPPERYPSARWGVKVSKEHWEEVILGFNSGEFGEFLKCVDFSKKVYP